MILDGRGIGNDPNVSAVELSKTPNIDKLSKNYNNSTLRTDGKHVGLPKGQMGNSEVGHMNIGAGRIVHQDLAKINISIRNNTLAKNKTLINSFFSNRRYCQCKKIISQHVVINFIYNTKK